MLGRFPTPPSLTRRPLLGLAYVFLGGLVGSAARSGAELLLPAGEGQFPGATLGVNIAGSFLLGLFMARRHAAEPSDEAFLFVAVGLLGSLTTFSLFSVEALALIGGGHPGVAAGYAAASIAGGLSAAWMGARVVRAR